MKTFTYSAWGNTYELSVHIKTNSLQNITIELIDTEDGFPYATASTHLPEVLLEPGEVLIKDYSENEGVFDFLLDNNIVKDTGKGIQSGFVWIPVAIVNPESEWGSSTKNNSLQPPPEQIDMKSGKSMWTINGYRIWSDSYTNACKDAQAIHSF